MTTDSEQTNRTVFITGVSSGLGKGLAEAHLDHGDRVLGLARRAPHALCAREGFRFTSCDLADAKQLGPSLGQLLEGVSGLDLVYLNAGILGEIKDMLEVSLDDLMQTMDVNLWANKRVIDALFATGLAVRQILTISSGAAVNGSRGWNGYSISKAALNMMTRLYAAELPETHFCALAPGLIDTAMQDYLCGMKPDARYEALGALRSSRGTDRMPQPRDAAETIIEKLDELKSRYESGAFVDIRNL